MPCTTYTPEEDSQRLRAECDQVTRLLCHVMREMPAKQRKTMCEELVSLGEWWAVHRQKDLERIALEKKRARQEAHIRRAIAKLSPEERRALGL